VSEPNQAVDFLYLLLLLVMVASAFLARRIPIGRSLQMAGAWVLIFGAVFIAFALKDDFAALGKRVMVEARGQGSQVAAGEGIRVRQSADGHFWVDGTINETKVRFLVDSGATVTSLSSETARLASVEPVGRPPVQVNTANGAILANRARAERVRIGSIERQDLAVHVSDSFGDTNVLGMNFLSSLSRWSVEGKWLVLEP
jgi:aspartyl protease family protein